jgi:hypothetical protein
LIIDIAGVTESGVTESGVRIKKEEEKKKIPLLLSYC